MPCRNEEEALSSVLSYLPKEVDEVIVVDNQSTDQTQQVAKRFGAKVFTETREDNGIGYGYALHKGIQKATGDIIVCMDADGSYPTKKIKTLVSYLLHKNITFISCSRLPFQDPKPSSHIRMLGVKILNMVIRVLYQYPLQDSLSGMWVFRKSCMTRLGTVEGGWNFSLQIKLHAITNRNIAFAEYRIPYRDREFGKSKQQLLKTGLTHFFYLLRVKSTEFAPAFPSYKKALPLPIVD